MEEITMLKVLDTIEWLIVRNRTVEAKRLVKQELDNLKDITQNKCKLLKVNKGYCRVCKNINCKLNENK